MDNASLDFIRPANPNLDATPHGRATKTQRLYLHSWRTGSQELLFDSDDDARRFAEKEGAKFNGPRKPT